MGWRNPGAAPGEKAVANYDEDSITTAVAASMECLKYVDIEKLDRLYFADTSDPCRERASPAIIATALDIGLFCRYQK
jgi:3-hydroxy-3-methylglutaryl CoA synthase